MTLEQLSKGIYIYPTHRLQQFAVIKALNTPSSRPSGVTLHGQRAFNASIVSHLLRIPSLASARNSIPFSG